MQDIICIRDELILEARPRGDCSHILLRREGEPGAVRVHLNEVRYLADAMCQLAAGMARSVAGEGEPECRVDS